MSGGELTSGAHINDDNLAIARQLQNRASIHAAQVIVLRNHGAQTHLQIDQALFSQTTQIHPQIGDPLFRQPVKHVFAVLARVHEPGRAQHLQVRARQLDTDVSLLRQGFHRFLTLTQQLDQFQTFRAGQRLADTADLLVENIFEFAHV